MKILLLPAPLANRLDGRLSEATGLQVGQAATAKRYFQMKSITDLQRCQGKMWIVSSRALRHKKT
ncbi:MAG: hypothetical protein A2073_00115 [Deltaproteobacteria bacterium GWC2_42_11]|nr:MAG: hypothetical protein A2073_00115 [Deltaproteobacteria bacterium GWC2_42_11]